MQCFEFSKQLLFEIRNQKRHLTDGAPDIIASEEAPVRLKLEMDVEYDLDKLPVRELYFTIKKPDGDVQFTLDVPEENVLRKHDDIMRWLDNVLDFAATHHGIAIKRAEKRSIEGNQTRTRVYRGEDDWEIRWVMDQGKLEHMPVEAAALQMDKLEDKTLEGWEEDSDNPKLMTKSFRSMQTAERIKELLHLIMEINGYDGREVQKDISLDIVPDGIALRMPKKYYETAMVAERHL